ncbi:MAG: RecX family transcriptional regulator [Candidatus Peregrinibacteria bacterium]|nr:RecX family transcriptional regulator [Candidatus Peregrinibacteria bacterium]MDZ4244710.1 RecX family transcriptional regulator [Candidatus Gracilibacteria bacterium]
MTSDDNTKTIKKEASRAYNYACRLLGRSDYTTHEIRTKLERKKYNKKIINDVIEKCIGFGFLNDKAYVGKYIRTRLALKPRGKYILRMELIKKGIDKELIETHFEDDPINERELACELIANNARRLMQLTPEKRKQKILYLLCSRGLPYVRYEQLVDLTNSLPKDR